MLKIILNTMILLGAVYLPGISTLFATNAAVDSGGKNQCVFVTYVNSHEQERLVRVLIKSIRTSGGITGHCRIYVMLGDPENFPGTSLKSENLSLIPFEMDSSFLNYPLAIKAFAAAQAEKAVGDIIQTMIWLDPGVIVTNSPDELIPGDHFDAVLRPVTLSNTISLSPGTPPNEFWEPIYRHCSLDYRALPELETIVDCVKMQPYYNCEVFSVNPRLGICAEWARVLSDLLRDETYQKKACKTFLKKLFLHQAVLSGVITSKIPDDRIKPLPLNCGYPFNQHERLPADRQISSLNDAFVLIFDDAWFKYPNWLNKIPVHEPLRQWLSEAYAEYLMDESHP